MKYFSLFSGIGDFELGIKQAIPGAVCVGFSEIDPYAIAIYKLHFKGHINYGDIAKINPEKIPDFDWLVGGFPCQSFSIAGHREGFNDTRGTLFFDIVRIIKTKQPRHFLFENVKGLLSHDAGRTFKIIIGAFDELGYDVSWQIINSKYHNVPQHRERIIISGHFRACEQSVRKIFSIAKSGKKITKLASKKISTATITAKAADGTRAGAYISEYIESQAKTICFNAE